MHNYFLLEIEVAHRQNEREKDAAQERLVPTGSPLAQRLRNQCRHTAAVLYARIDSQGVRSWLPAASRGPRTSPRLSTAESN
jgi:hypothetical protein